MIAFLSFPFNLNCDHRKPHPTVPGSVSILFGWLTTPSLALFCHDPGASAAPTPSPTRPSTSSVSPPEDRAYSYAGLPVPYALSPLPELSPSGSALFLPSSTIPPHLSSSSHPPIRVTPALPVDGPRYWQRPTVLRKHCLGSSHDAPARPRRPPPSYRYAG